MPLTPAPTPLDEELADILTRLALNVATARRRPEREAAAHWLPLIEADVRRAIVNYHARAGLAATDEAAA